MRVGRAALNDGMKATLARWAECLPSILTDTLRSQWDMLGKLDAQIQEIEQRLQAWMRGDRASWIISEVPSVVC